MLAGLAAALTAPLYAISPASAAVLFTCPSIDSPVTSFMGFSPGLSHAQTAQNADSNHIGVSAPCSNGEQAFANWGSAVLHNPSTSTRPIGCPVAWGGLGPDYLDQTPILFGPDGGNTAFEFFWYGAAAYSYGSFKAKAGPTGTQYRFVFIITAGPYAPPAGKKTKVKFKVSITPRSGFSYTCANDSDPLEFVDLASVGNIVVTQK